MRTTGSMTADAESRVSGLQDTSRRAEAALNEILGRIANDSEIASIGHGETAAVIEQLYRIAFPGAAR